MIPHRLNSVVDINRNLISGIIFQACLVTKLCPSRSYRNPWPISCSFLSFKIPISKSDSVQTNYSKLFLRSDITLTCIRSDFDYLLIHHQFIVLWTFSSVNFQFRIPSSTSKLPAKWFPMTVRNCCTNKRDNWNLTLHLALASDCLDQHSPVRTLCSSTDEKFEWQTRDGGRGVGDGFGG